MKRSELKRRRPMRQRPDIKRTLDRTASEAWAKGARAKGCAICGATGSTRRGCAGSPRTRGCRMNGCGGMCAIGCRCVSAITWRTIVECIVSHWRRSAMRPRSSFSSCASWIGRTHDPRSGFRAGHLPRDRGLLVRADVHEAQPVHDGDVVEKRVDSAGLKRLLNLAPSCAELMLIDGVLQFLPTQGGS